MLKGKLRLLATIFFAGIVFAGCVPLRDKDPFGGPYTITFLDYDETVLKTQEITSLLDIVIPPEELERIGYTFTGWSASFEEVVNDLVVYAEYSPILYDIIYHLSLGEFVTTYPTEYTIETETFDLIVPTKVGHTFDGWYDAASEGQLISSVPQGSYGTLELYAHWLINQYSITFETNEGSLVNPIEEDYGALIEAPIVPVKEFYLFDGWYSDIELTTAYTFTVMPSQNITLYAKWVIVNYTVTFEDYDGRLLKTETVDHESSATPPDEPDREGYTFIGWDLPYTIITEVITIKAFYEINTYTVYFYEEDGTTIIESISYEYGADLTGHIVPAAPDKEGYTFDGWISLPATMLAGDITRTATYTINSYNVIYYEEDGVTIIESTSYEYSADLSIHIEPDAPEKVGYTFDGWVALPATMLAGDITRTAIYTINSYNVIYYEENGVIIIESTSYQYGADLSGHIEPIAPEYPVYTFDGWVSLPLTMPAGDVTRTATYTINSYLVIYYNPDQVTVIQSTSYEYGADLTGHVAPEAPDIEGHIFDGWIALPLTMPAGDVHRVPTYRAMINISMVQVGEIDTTYTIPIWPDDSGTATVTGGYLMATTQTTYELWYEVRVWAEAHGYHFQNLGREGHDGTIGATPTASKLEPVTRVSWRDTIVWLNALSEMSGYNPVYRTSGGAIIKDSRDANAALVDAAIQTNNNGYRLPTSNEWEMAARWKHDTESTDGSILVGGRYWTPGNYASGATADYNNESATRAVAWYWGATGGNMTRAVGQLLPNHLGIYDISGNVWEWTYTASGSSRVMRGGCWGFGASDMQVGGVYSRDPSLVSSYIGFRFVRNS